VSVWQELGDGCYRRRYERYDVNVGVVRGAAGLLVFDTRGSPVQGRELVAELATLDRAPVRHLVNSHWHFDHVLGNQCFTGAPARWGHPGLTEMFTRHQDDALELPQRYDPALASELVDLELVLPDHEVRDAVTVDLGDRAVELRHFGRGHTSHDIVAVVPGAELMFAGDLLEESAPPSYGDDCFPIAWARTAGALLAAVPRDGTIVPGHGDVMSLTDAREQANAIALVADLIRLAHAAHEPVERAVGATAGAWPFPPELLDDGVRRGYAELDGTAA
jgi:glyoxylase-like metal-dependent hydrolase (beta-lactamase superfamily II)